MSFLTAEHTPRVVLDSNVWIDILVFDDPATRPIADALSAGSIEAVIDARCLAELTRVLDYPQFARFDVDKAAALAQVAAWTELASPPPEAVIAQAQRAAVKAAAAEGATGLAYGPAAGTADAEAIATSTANAPPASVSPALLPPIERPLPQCRDRDDQKFLELTRHVGATWLVSKDRELLRMAKRIARDFGFSIGLPAAFTAACLPP